MHFGIFIIMYKTFIINNFWMIFPIENRHFFTYIIERLFQTIDEGKDTVIENYEKNKNNEEKTDPYNRIDNDDDSNNFKSKNFLKIIQKKSDKTPFYFYNKLRNIWEYNDHTQKSEKILFIYAAARQGLIQYLLLASLSNIKIIELKKLEFYDYTEIQGQSHLISYLNANLNIITYFLNTQIDIITKDLNISNSDKKDKFLKYLWKEYEILLNL